MKINRPKLIAIVGGSGAGKTWLADRLQKSLGASAARLSLDDFYRSRAHLPSALLKTVNFDHPRAIDWTLFETVLQNFRKGRTVSVPHYDFRTHRRVPEHQLWMPRPVVIVDGLWLLWRRKLRPLFDLRIYLDCPAELRLERRAARDVVERGRTLNSVREQFWKTVAPMHERYVAPQRERADIVLEHPVREADVKKVLDATKKVMARDQDSRPQPASSVDLLTTPEIFVGGALSVQLEEKPDYAIAS